MSILNTGESPWKGDSKLPMKPGPQPWNRGIAPTAEEQLRRAMKGKPSKADRKAVTRAEFSDELASRDKDLAEVFAMIVSRISELERQGGKHG